MEEVLTTALTAVPHCLALADPGASDVMDLCPRMALPCHKVSVSNIDFAFSHYRKLALPAPGENILFSLVSISLALATLWLETPAASTAQPLVEFQPLHGAEAEGQAGYIIC